MTQAWGVSGIGELRRALEGLGRDAKARLPSAAARALASLATEAIARDPDLRPSPWPPLADSTLGRAGAASKGARDARRKAAEFRRKAEEQGYAAAWLEGKAKAKAEKAAANAAAKAKEWRAKAKAAKDAGAGGRKILYDSGALFRSIAADGDRVVSDRPYAVFHQFGSLDGKHPPARPFVPVREDGTLAPKAARILGRDLAAELERIARRR